MRPQQASQIPEHQVRLACLQNLCERTEDPLQRKQLASVIEQYRKDMRNNMLLKQKLTKQQIKDLKSLSEHFKMFHMAFRKLVKQEKYAHIAPFKVVNFLISIQKAIQPNKEMMKYMFELVKERKKHTDWTKQFIDQWAEVAQAQRQREQQVRKDAERMEAEVKKEAKTAKDVSKEKEREMRRQADDSSKQSSSDNSEQRVGRVERPQVKRNLVPRMEPVKERKNQLDTMLKYFQARKDLPISSAAKTREIAEYLNNKLELFMKQTITQIIKISKLHNRRKGAEQGNQFSYYSSKNGHLHHEIPLLVTPGVKISRTELRNKLQIFTEMRNRQIYAQDQLFQRFQQQKESEKKLDRKVDNYILKPREGQMVQIWKQSDDQNNLESTISIAIPHVLYYLENHHWWKDSLLLFNAYQY